MGNTKIDWCDYTYNFVIGCKNNCPYCYAKKMNNRFKWIKDFNKPEWREHMFQCKFPKKPSRIFLNSMSDIAFWQIDWIEKTLDKIMDYPQHRFLFLTKHSKFYEQYEFSTNCWLGITITNQFQMNLFADNLFHLDYPDRYKIFMSIEPILEEIKLYVNPDWLIVGAETGNKKGKVYPELRWIESLYEQCKKQKIPFFMKESLQTLWDGSLIQNCPEDLTFSSTIN